MMAEYVDPNDLHRVVATCIIWKKSRGAFRFLVKLRCLEKEPFRGRWENSGGGLELGDYVKMRQDSADGWHSVAEYLVKREVREEVGLDIRNPQYLGSFSFIRADGVPVFGLRFFARYRGGKVVLDKEAVTFKWVTVRDLDSLNLIGTIARDIRAVNRKLMRKTRPART